VKGAKMTSRKKTVSTTILLVVLFVLFMGARANRADAVQDTGVQSDMPAYAEYGSYSVGIHDLATEGNTLLEITLWYPALKADSTEEAITYPYEMKMGDPIGTVTVAKYGGKAVQDAPYALSAGPYPLVVLSPGFSIGASSYAWLAEHLASYGFVVLAPEHQEHLDPENELWRSAIERPQDILAVFAFVDEQVESGGQLDGLIDVNQVAVIGHSYGGYTSLAAGGAQIDTDSFQSYCESTSKPDEPGAWLCAQLTPHMTEMASLAGLDSTPDGLWPAWADPRVDVVVSMAGDAFFFGRPGLAEFDVPVMAIGGTEDKDSPYMWSTQPAYEYVSSPRKVRVALEGAEHMIFTGPCEKIPWYLKFFSGEFCADPGWDRVYAHNLVRHFTTAFLLSELKQDSAASDALASNAVDFTGVTYDVQGY
jgi:predicted dienelactone hydrolase